MNNLPPSAEKGKRVKDVWNDLEAWARRARILPGQNARIAYTAQGTVVGFAPRRQNFTGAFNVSLVGGETAVRVGFGTVEGIEPTMGGKKITDSGAEMLLKKGEFDSENCSWIGLKLRHKDDGGIDKDDEDVLTVVQSKEYRVWEANAIFHPLAVLKKRKVDEQEIMCLYQIEYFNLRATWVPSGKKLLLFPAA